VKRHTLTFLIQNNKEFVMKKRTRNIIGNMFLSVLLGVFIIILLQVWNVTTFYPGYFVTTGNGYTHYVSPSFKVDVVELIRRNSKLWHCDNVLHKPSKNENNPDQKNTPMI
jgi:cytoskeletal protein RodZ